MSASSWRRAYPPLTAVLVAVPLVLLEVNPIGSVAAGAVAGGLAYGAVRDRGPESGTDSD